MSLSPFIRDQIDKIAKAEGFIDYVIEQESGSNHGEGFIATMTAVTLIGQRKVGNETGQSKLNLMCKLLPDNMERRAAFNSTIIFEREVYVYNKVLSVFDQFQREKQIPIADRFTEYPKCYAAVSDVENDEHTIIMENLRMSGFGLWDKMKPVDYDTVCLYMKALGKFHALSFAIRDQKPEIFKELENLEDVFVTIINIESNPFIGVLTGACDKGLSLLDHPDEIRVLTDIRDNLRDEFVRLISKKLAGDFYVIDHGDSWNNNLFYSHEGSSKPQKISLLDWQISRCASPGLDISYYLMSSTNRQVRERYTDLLKVYHNSLSNMMRVLGSDPEKWFTFDDLIQQLKTVGKYGVLMAPCLLQIMVSDPKNIVDMDEITEDSELSVVASLNESTENVYKERLSDVIKDAIRFGWV